MQLVYFLRYPSIVVASETCACVRHVHVRPRLFFFWQTYVRARARAKEKDGGKQREKQSEEKRVFFTCCKPTCACVHHVHVKPGLFGGQHNPTDECTCLCVCVRERAREREAARVGEREEDWIGVAGERACTRGEMEGERCNTLKGSGPEFCTTAPPSTNIFSTCCVCHDLFICALLLMHMRAKTYSCVTWLIQQRLPPRTSSPPVMHAMTHSYVCNDIHHDSFICVTWTHACVWLVNRAKPFWMIVFVDIDEHMYEHKDA